MRVLATLVFPEMVRSVRITTSVLWARILVAAVALDKHVRILPVLSSASASMDGLLRQCATSSTNVFWAFTIAMLKMGEDIVWIQRAGMIVLALQGMLEVEDFVRFEVHI